jgi:hypothetical protein
MSFGSDFSAIDDIDQTWSVLRGDRGERRALAQAIARRFVTPRGGLFYDESYGLDLREFVSDGGADPSLVEPMIEAEARRDERVVDCMARISVVGATINEWRVRINPRAIDGQSYPFTLLVTGLTVAMLNEGQ